MANGEIANTEMISLLSKLHIDEDVPIYEDAYPLLNPVDVFRCYITRQMVELTGKDIKTIYPALAWTNTLDKGDLMFAVPRLQNKGTRPADLAEKLAAEFPTSKIIKKPEPFGISLRFDFNPEILPSLVLPQIYSRGANYGLNPNLGLSDPKNPDSGAKKVIVEFSSPNIAKEFHIGHLRSTIIGAFLANLYEGVGWEVIRMNYLGDWGRQYGLLAEGWNRYGSEEAFNFDPIAHLFDIYVKISSDFKPEEDAYNAAKKQKKDTASLETQGLLAAAKDNVVKMEAGDEDLLALWRRMRNISINKYKSSYARLNIAFDDYSGESTVTKETMDEAERVLIEKGVAEFNDGALIVDFKKHGPKSLEVTVVRNRNGTTSYLLRDIGAAIQRYRQYKMDRMIYVIMSEQNVHVARFVRVLELMGGEYAEVSKRIQHITFGKIRGMSTRRGKVKFLGDVLNDIGDAMHDVMRRNEEKYAQVQNPEQVSDALGISSIMVQDMSGKRINDYDFDLQRMLSFEGDTGPYLQYAHARLCSIARKTKYSHDQLSGADFSLLHEPHAVNLVRLMASWPDTVIHTYKTLEPSTVVTYLFRLTHQLSSSYDVLKVIGAPEGPETSLARAALYEAARQVISNGMTLLGLSPVESM